jgi:hypothetical protein
MITAITPTGDRPLAMSLCERWMTNQTVHPDQWLVIDDGQVPFTPSVPMEYVRREPQAGDPRHTLALKLQQAIPLIKGDKIMIIEDDEYYAPTYVEQMSRQLDSGELVGIKQNRYYHVPTGGYYLMHNMGHASLAETAFMSGFLPTFRKAVDASINLDYLDIRIWRMGKERAAHNFKFGTRTMTTSRARSMAPTAKSDLLLFSDADNPLYVGIKGLPGRAGIGMGHNPAMYTTRDTAGRRVLKQWIPKDYQVYLDIAGQG